MRERCEKAFACLLVHLGRYPEGIALLQKALVLFHRGPSFLGALGWALLCAGRAEEAQPLLEELRSRPLPGPAVIHEAWLLAERGEMDAAWKILEQARDEFQGFVVMTGLPGFDPFREDPRFAEFMESLGLRAR